jgi:chromosome segregation ATPase
MQNIKTTVTAYNQAREHLDNLQAQMEKCRAAMGLGHAHSEKIWDLQQQRSAAEAQAFLDGKPADLKAIDAEIAKLEKQSADDRKTAETATTAANLLEPQIAQAKADLQKADEAIKKAIAANAGETFKLAEASYHQAAEKLKEALAAMLAAASVSNRAGFHGQVVLVNGLIAALGGKPLGSNPAVQDYRHRPK